MSRYKKYLQEIVERKPKGLQPKPIDTEELLDEVIHQIKDKNHQHRSDSINFFIYNVLPGTTSAAKVKAKFLKEITLLGQAFIKEDKKSVGQLLKDNNAKVILFKRFEVGEGIEKKVENFADEVMKQIEDVK